MIIPVQHGLEVLIDIADSRLLAGMKVYVKWDSKSRFWRPYCYYKENGKQRLRGLARVILGLEKGDKREAEHINPNATLNNRRSNLRIATRSQNNANRRLRKDNSSGFKGVVAYGKGYRAQIMVDGKALYLGKPCQTKEEAYEIYCAAARKYHGEFTRPEKRSDA